MVGDVNDPKQHQAIPLLTSLWTPSRLEASRTTLAHNHFCSTAPTGDRPTNYVLHAPSDEPRQLTCVALGGEIKLSATRHAYCAVGGLLSR